MHTWVYRYVCISLSLSLSFSLHIYIYMYIHRERERSWLHLRGSEHLGGLRPAVPSPKARFT